MNYAPTMTRDYSRISDTARAVNANVWPKIKTCLQRMAPRIAGMPADVPFGIADYGSADGVNSSDLFENMIHQVRSINASLPVRLVYIDLADAAEFEKFWTASRLAAIPGVAAQYIQRSFYRKFPEMTGALHIGFSSTALHWLDAQTAPANLFQHPSVIQPNQLTEIERKIYSGKWQSDWQLFLRECAASLVSGGALFLAHLADLGGDRWPASAGYNHLRDICCELNEENRISRQELNAVFIPDYFAAPGEIQLLLAEEDLKKLFILKSCEPLTVPCAYFATAQSRLDDPAAREALADTLAHVVRAWSESSLRIGLNENHQNLIDEIYQRLKRRFQAKPEGLPYQYCLLELEKPDR